MQQINSVKKEQQKNCANRWSNQLSYKKTVKQACLRHRQTVPRGTKLSSSLKCSVDAV